MSENPTQNPTNARLETAEKWIRQILRSDQFRLSTVSGDASFRRYFRIHRDGRPSLVLMDAPPDKENSRPFLDVANRLRDAGIHAPAVYHFDLELGFGIIEDLGDELYKTIIRQDSANTVVPNLLGLLADMAGNVRSEGLPPYDDALLQQELDLFPDWYLRKHKQCVLTGSEMETWQSLCESLLANAKEQPQVFVHRDFHSCNLLYNQGQPPAVIDFQDAVKGPISYDFISLIWDRYVHWPRPQIETWMEDMRVRLESDFSPDEWIRTCDLMGMQRNLKIVGIFARLHYRDHKQGYLEMIPMFYRYLLDVAHRYPEFSAFNALLEDPTCAP